MPAYHLARLFTSQMESIDKARVLHCYLNVLYEDTFRFRSLYHPIQTDISAIDLGISGNTLFLDD